jgi:hypothetical protein
MGFLQMLRRARDMLDSLGAEDRVAVVSFDSHLKVWTDFTPIARACGTCSTARSCSSACPSCLPATRRPSWSISSPGRPGARPRRRRRCGSWARRSAELPGTKSLVLFGWGMGSWSPGVGVFLDHDYGPARQALVEGHVTVFALDVTNADYHTLEVGLEQVAEDTGGFYTKTHLFPSQAFDRLGRALEGHYVLTFAKPDLKRASTTSTSGSWAQGDGAGAAVVRRMRKTHRLRDRRDVLRCDPGLGHAFGGRAAFVRGTGARVRLRRQGAAWTCRSARSRPWTASRSTTSPTRAPKGGRVPAYLLVAPGAGRHAGLLFMHWGQGNRSEFLAEGLAAARARARPVS